LGVGKDADEGRDGGVLAAGDEAGQEGVAGGQLARDGLDAHLADAIARLGGAGRDGRCVVLSAVERVVQGAQAGSAGTGAKQDRHAGEREGSTHGWGSFPTKSVECVQMRPQSRPLPAAWTYGKLGAQADKLGVSWQGALA